MLRAPKDDAVLEPIGDERHFMCKRIRKYRSVVAGMLLYFRHVSGHKRYADIWLRLGWQSRIWNLAQEDEAIVAKEEGVPHRSSKSIS